MSPKSPAYVMLRTARSFPPVECPTRTYCLIPNRMGLAGGCVTQNRPPDGGKKVEIRGSRDLRLHR